MFTGIIEEVGTCQESVFIEGGKRLMIKIKSDPAHNLCAGRIPNSESIEQGESISINGVCLTVIKAEKDWFQVFASNGTLKTTTLGNIRKGTPVNIERALKIGDRLGGHLVQGHIDGKGKVISKRVSHSTITFSISTERELFKYIVPKGSITIDGVSLTVAGKDNSCFTVSIIPYTQDNTTLKFLKTGDFVNIETDIIGKYLLGS